MSKYFPKPYEPFGRDINFSVDLSNYATKNDIKNITHVGGNHWHLKKYGTHPVFNTRTETIIY